MVIRYKTHTLNVFEQNILKLMNIFVPFDA